MDTMGGWLGEFLRIFGDPASSLIFIILMGAFIFFIAVSLRKILT